VRWMTWQTISGRPYTAAAFHRAAQKLGAARSAALTTVAPATAAGAAAAAAAATAFAAHTSSPAAAAYSTTATSTATSTAALGTAEPQPTAVGPAAANPIPATPAADMDADDAKLGARKASQAPMGEPAAEENMLLDAIESNLGATAGDCPADLALQDRVFGYCELDMERGEAALMEAVSRHPVVGARQMSLSTS